MSFKPWKHLPDSLVARALIVLVIGLVVSNLAGLFFYSRERHETMTAFGGHQAAERIAAAVRLVEANPPEARTGLLRSVQAPGFRVVWTLEPRLPAAPDDPRTGAVRKELRERLERRIDDDSLRIAYVEPGEDGFAPPWRMGMHRRLDSGELAPGLWVSVRAVNGGWLTFLAPYVRLSPVWASPHFLTIVMTTATVLLLAMWGFHRAARPLRLLARAAERLGRDVNAPPLEVRGPREVRKAARAFNDMQERIRAFVNDRTQMLAAISHDLRTPITRLRLRAELIEDDESRAKMLADLAEMEAMIAETLAFARDEAGDEAMKPLDLAALLQAVCDDAQDAGGEAVYAGPDHATLSGRPTALKRVFANLVGNAVKYGERARVRLDPSKDGVVITIDDDGSGIPDDQLGKVFDPFYRVEGSRNRMTGGVGLGLAVVRSIVRAHGGEVALANRSGGGLSATVTLPVVGAR